MVDQTSQFYAILTNVGAAKQANADALGIPWKITQMAVGDGNPGGVENPALPQPDASWTSLLNEWRRAPLNQLKVDDKDNSVIVAEQVIPAEIGGRWIREVGLYDADGDLVAVANCAPTYKPLLNQGSGRTQVVRMNLVVSSSSNVQLKIDPSVVLATREWVTEELARQDFKHSVLAATTANIALSGLQTVDGVALVAGARVLVKNQAAAKDNGLYLVVAGGPWARCNDADSSAKVTPGLLVQVERGTANGDSAWQLVTDAPITLGVTALAFEMAFGRTGVAAGTYRSVTVDAGGRVTAATNPSTVAGYGLTDVYTKTQVDQALALKAPLASPTFTGDPKAPTPAVTDNDTSVATTAFVQSLLGALGWGGSGVAGSSIPAGSDLNNYKTPGTYGQTSNSNATLALNYPVVAAGTLFVQAAGSQIVTQSYRHYLANRQYIRALFQGAWTSWDEIPVLNSPTFTGDPRAPTPAKSDNDTSIATTAFVRNALGLFGIGLSVSSEIITTSLNTFRASGFYCCSGNAEGAPVTQDGLLIEGLSTGSRHVQLYITTASSAFFYRVTPLGDGVYGAWNEVWDSRNTPKMDGLSDSALGRIVTVGGHGVGRGIISVETDLNKYTTPGNYLSAQFLLNLPVGWASSGRRYVLVVEGLGDSGHLTQRLTSGLSEEETLTAVRSYSSNRNWSAWRIQAPADRLGNMAAAPVAVSADTVLTASQAGLLFVTGSGNQFTLPLLSTVQDGSCFHFLFNYGGGSVKGASNQIIQAGGAPSSVYIAGYGERLTLVKRSNAWYAGGGGIGIDGFLSSQFSNGWSKDPNGIIEQWGSAIITISDGVSVACDIAFNIPFPNACWNIQMSAGVNAASGAGYTTTRQSLSFGVPTQTGCWARMFNDQGVAASVRRIFWRARGN